MKPLIILTREQVAMAVQWFHAIEDLQDEAPHLSFLKKADHETVLQMKAALADNDVFL